MDRAVFINYRGVDSHSYGALLYRELKEQFGEHRVFLDCESIPAGADFVEELLRRVRSAPALLAVVGPDWLTTTDSAGRRRIDDPNDWIRRELSEAFATNVTVIPILIEQTKIPAAADLPDELQPLSRCQYRRLRHHDTTNDLARIVTDLVLLDDTLVQLVEQRRNLLERVPRLGGKLPRVSDALGRAVLGIHPAIPLPEDADPSLSTELPSYVPRDIDAALRTWLNAHTESGGFALIVGPAAAGKTRCAYEAVKAVTPQWSFLLPPNGRCLLDLLDAGQVPARTVLWLNDIDAFLGPDGLTASAVRRLLVDTRWPILLIGTIWPERLDALIGDPLPILSRDTAGREFGAVSDGDLRADAREILSMQATQFRLRSTFSTDELARARLVAATDPRLAEATQTEVAEVAETLAAVTKLLDRWQHTTNPYGAATITAAVIARRCGHPEPLPADVLLPLAEHCLTDAERARAEGEWFVDALDWARQPVIRGGRAAPLTAQSAHVGAIDGDQVSDVLVQHETTEHRLTDIPWDVLISHSTPQACLSIGRRAYLAANQPTAAMHALGKAADAGDLAATFDLGVIHVEQGDVGEAERRYRQAAEAGQVGAMNNLGVLVWKRGETAEAKRWFHQAADAGNRNAWANLGGLLAERGDIAQAERWFRRAADAGSTGAMCNLGVLLGERGETAEAEHWYRQAADAGISHAMFILGALLGERGETAEAEYWFRRAADAGGAGAMDSLGVLLGERGETAEAEHWCRRAAVAGDVGAMCNLGVFLVQQGTITEAEAWYRKSADAGNTTAMFNLAGLLADRGDKREAEHWLRQAADAGDTGAMDSLGALLGERGETAEAEHWCRQAAVAGDIGAMCNLGVFLVQQGNTTEAEHWYREAADAGDIDSMSNLGVLLIEQGDMAEAERWFRQAAEAGSATAMYNLGGLYSQRGNVGEAERWWRQAAEAGEIDAMQHIDAPLNEPQDGGRTNPV